MAKTHEQTYTDEQAGGRKEGRKKKSSMGKFKSTKKGIKRNYKKKTQGSGGDQQLQAPQGRKSRDTVLKWCLDPPSEVKHLNYVVLLVQAAVAAVAHQWGRAFSP